MAALAPHLTPPERDQALSQALEAARAIGDEGSRAEALAALAPHLTPPLLGPALEAARAIGAVGSRAEALAALAPHLTPPERDQALSQALEAARAIGDEESRARALAALAPHLVKLSPGTLYPLWNATLQLAATRTRRDLLSDLRALVPILATLGGAEAVAETFCAIQDVGRWWP